MKTADLKAIKIDATLEFDVQLPNVGMNGTQQCSGSIRRHKSDLWSLNHKQNSVRNRWGTAVEILEDFEHLMSSGQLPSSKGYRF